MTDKLDHFDALEFHIKINKSEAFDKIQSTLTNYDVDIKQIKRAPKDKLEDIESLIIVCNFNKNLFKKNELISAITSIEHVAEVVVE